MVQEVDVEQRAARVAVIGSGPSGFYAAAALLAVPSIEVDVIDRLPTPYGLVRGGVAPDHQKIKTVIRAYEKTAADPRFRFFGNVCVGVDLRADELLGLYDAVVYAVGAESANQLGIPGEDLVGSHSATDFVGWYNGHPDHQHHAFDLSTSAAAVVGVGNVSMDVSRILACGRELLASSDITDPALAAIADSGIRDVYILGRRGPAQMAFTAAELKEIAEIPGVDVRVLPDEAAVDPVSAASIGEHSDLNVRKNLELLRELSLRPPDPTARVRVHLRMCVSPVQVLGVDGRVTGLRLERNALEADGRGGVRARGTGVTEVIPLGLVFRAVGYRGRPVPGVPFDERRGTIPNAEGRVIDGDGRVIPRTYVVGWAKRGPSGLIGTNRADSKATVEKLFEDLPSIPPDPGRTGVAAEAFLRGRQPRLVEWTGWRRLDAHEVDEGQKRAKIRHKVTTVLEMLSIGERK